MSSVFGAGCGSEVNGAGGSGGSTSSSGSGGSGGSGDPAQDCADTCHKLETLNCNLPGGGSDCNTQCTDQIAGYPTECADAVAAYFACLVQNTTTCDYPMTCNNLEMALSDCKAMYGCSGDGTCYAGMGMNGDAECGCDDTCKGVKYEAKCTTASGATMTNCDCLVNGTSMGQCQQTDANACGVNDSCCNATYFKL